MTRTSEAKPGAINGEHYKATTAVISSYANAHTNGGTESATAAATLAAAATEAVTEAPTSAASTPVTRTAGASLSRSTGYATMPRRSLNGINNNCIGGGNNAKYGSGFGGTFNHKNNTAMAADNATSDATADNCRKLAATLNTLDLAVVRDLTDDDGEDSYTAFQEYLERVEVS